MTAIGKEAEGRVWRMYSKKTVKRISEPSCWIERWRKDDDQEQYVDHLDLDDDVVQMFGNSVVLGQQVLSMTHDGICGKLFIFSSSQNYGTRFK